MRTAILDLGVLSNSNEVRAAVDRDIALVRLQEHNPANRDQIRDLPGFQWVSKDRGWNVIPGDQVLVREAAVPGADVFMFGYPTSLTAGIANLFDPTTPLIRKGIVSELSTRSAAIVIDCPAYFGNSGGPVIQVTKADFISTHFHLIGIVSGFIPFREEWGE